MGFLFLSFWSLVPSADAQDAEDEAGKAGDLEVETDEEAEPDEEFGGEEAEWWDRNWRYRRKLVFEGTGLLMPTAGVVFFSEPDPLLLYNSGRCKAELADVRLVSPGGEVLPFCVIRFGHDDSSSWLWFKPQKGASKSKQALYLYYGNPKGELLPHRLPSGVSPPQVSAVSVQVFPEIEVDQKTKPDKGQTQGVGSEGATFFKDTIFVEAEDILGPDVKPELRSTILRNDSAASGGRLVQLKDQQGSPSLLLAHSLETVRPGQWFIHVRCGDGDMPGGYGLTIDGKSPEVSGRPAGRSGFHWDTLSMEFPAGKHELRVQAQPGQSAALDCIFLTQDARTIPDFRDFNGPVWMRFRLRNAEVKPYYIDFYCCNVTYSTKGMQGETACWLFKDEMAPSAAIANRFKDKPEKKIADDSWTPWGKALPTGSWTWFSEIRFVGAGANLEVEYEFATRPDSSRVFRHGVESTGPISSFYVHMPSDIRWANVRDMTLSFGQWGRQRFEMAQSLGFKEGEGPKHIVAGTMGASYSLEEARFIFKTCRWLGLNVIDLGLNGAPSADALDPLFQESGIPWRWTHAWVYGHGSGTGAAFDPMKSFRENVNADLAAQGDSYYKNLVEGQQKANPALLRRTRFNIMGDEIGAFTSFETINSDPVQRGFFIEYLKEHGLTPEFFGYEKWDEVRAFGYRDAPTEEALKKEQVEKAEKESEAEFQKMAAAAKGSETLEEGEAEPGDDVESEITRAQQEEARKAQAKLPDPLSQDEFRKRAWHWTQKFRSHYTALSLRHYSAGMLKYFPKGLHGGPNLQAMPVQVGRMWDGELNIFDLGRENAVNALLVEDWWGSPHNVAFAMNLQRAAARKNGQELAALLVGGGPGPRIMANLMEGCRFFLFYLYGPIYNIGPVWAEDRGTHLQIGEWMRQIARAEPDILAARPRPRDAALLVANTSEINAAFFPYPFNRERISIYAALKDTQTPVDVVGEEEILEDAALDRYCILYVCDPHVESRAQQKIKDWVAAGGTLWADYGGLARKEYDERSKMLDEVFGLADRGEILPFSLGGRGWACYGNITIPEGPGLKIPAGEVLQEDPIEGLHTPAGVRGLFYQPDYKLSTGKALATFQNGRPAIVYNRFGKGQAFLFGFQAGLAYTGCYGNWTHALPFKEPSTSRRAQLMAAPARAAGVQNHLVVDHHFLQSAVHDGPAQTVVYLNNLGAPMKNAAVTVRLLKKPVSAYSSRGRQVLYEYESPNATFHVDLPSWEGEIVVLRHAE